MVSEMRFMYVCTILPFHHYLHTHKWHPPSLLLTHKHTQEVDIYDHLQIKAELCLNDNGILYYYSIIYTTITIFFCWTNQHTHTEQHLTKALSLLPEYFWYTHVHFVSHSSMYTYASVSSLILLCGCRMCLVYFIILWM